MNRGRFQPKWRLLSPQSRRLLQPAGVAERMSEIRLVWGGKESRGGGGSRRRKWCTGEDMDDSEDVFSRLLGVLTEKIQ